MEVVDIEDNDLVYRRIAPEFIKPNGELASPVYMRDGRPDDAVSVDLARFTSPAESAARGAESNRIHARCDPSRGFARTRLHRASRSAA